MAFAVKENSPAVEPLSSRFRITLAQWAARPEPFVDEWAYAFDPEADAMGRDPWRMVEGVELLESGPKAGQYEVEFANGTVIAREADDPIYVARRHFMVLAELGAVKVEPKPGAWSVYYDGRLLVSGMSSRRAAEGLVAPSQRDGFTFVCEPDQARNYTDDQHLILAHLRLAGKLSATRILAIVDAIASADAALNNAAIPTYSDLVMAIDATVNARTDEQRRSAQGALCALLARVGTA